MKKASNATDIKQSVRRHRLHNRIVHVSWFGMRSQQLKEVLNAIAVS